MQMVKYEITFPSSSFISKLTSNTYISVLGSDIVVIDAVISIAEVTELLMERGTL